MPPKDQPSVGLYPKAMGENYFRLPQAVQDLHHIDSAHGVSKDFEGRCTVTRGTNILTQIIANIFRFPKPGTDIDLKITITRDDDKEIWERYFDSFYMKTTQKLGRGEYKSCIIETFGPAAIYLMPVLENSELHLKTAAWSIFGLRLPLFLAPRGETFEYEAADTYHFHVDVALPILGRLVKYEGWLSDPKAE